MAKKYSAQEILNMAVGLIEQDLAADNNADGKITAEDARYQQRLDSGLLPTDTVGLMAENIINKIIRDSSSYSYDVNADPLYSQYKKQYDEMGDKASEDIMGLAASLTGGYGNSYGLTKASEEKKKYSDALTEKSEELEEKAYERYLDSMDSLYSLYELLSDAEKNEDEKSEAALNFALKAASYGDTSYLNALGVDTSDTDFNNAKEKAEFFAKYKDYSLLSDLGVDISSLSDEELQEVGEFYAKYGDYSILKALGIDTSQKENEEYIDRLIKLSKLG